MGQLYSNNTTLLSVDHGNPVCVRVTGPGSAYILHSRLISRSELFVNGTVNTFSRYLFEDYNCTSKLFCMKKFLRIGM